MKLLVDATYVVTDGVYANVHLIVGGLLAIAFREQAEQAMLLAGELGGGSGLLKEAHDVTGNLRRDRHREPH
jgi:hypothetical protein